MLKKCMLYYMAVCKENIKTRKVLNYGSGEECLKYFRQSTKLRRSAGFYV